MPVASIGDQDIDWPVLAPDRACHRGDRLLVGHIDDSGDSIGLVECLVSRRVFRPAHRPDDTMTLLQCFYGKRSSETRTDSSDEKSLLLCTHVSRLLL